jgi:YfiH family protein
MSVATRTWTARDGLLWSPALERLGVVAGFTTRAQGSMAGSHHDLDVQERNRRALARRLGFDAVVRMKQVHGNDVVRVDGPLDPWPVADAMWTDRDGVLLGVAAADCVPVLVAAPDGPIGVAHAGWAGTTQRVATALVEAMVAHGAAREQLVASLGPSIGPCCYAVGDERAATIAERVGDAALHRDGDRVVFDLWSANTEQLREAGVGVIEIAGLCTLSGGADLWSYRGRGPDGRYGTQLGFLGRGGRGPRSAERREASS